MSLNKKLYNKNDYKRVCPLLKEDDYRTHFRRDYSRLIHSPSFRRLQGKTQLFPNNENDFFRNRLTHSLEVAQIAKSIAIKLNSDKRFIKREWTIDYDLIEFAGLAHDIGHPPFGHKGERALNDVMRPYGGFEGNAQTFRIISHLEKKELPDLSKESALKLSLDNRVGLNVTSRTLASILKYCQEIPEKNESASKLLKGFYSIDKKLVNTIIDNVTNEKNYDGPFKTIECQIMDLADDIAYSTYDFEDALKAGFNSMIDCMSLSDNILQRIADKIDGVNKGDVATIIENLFRNTILSKVYSEYYENNQKNHSKKLKYNELDSIVRQIYNTSNDLSSNGYFRINFTSFLVDRFINGIKMRIDSSYPCLTKVYFNNTIKKEVEVLKNLTYLTVIDSSVLKVAEFRGYDIIKSIFGTLMDEKKGGTKLLPDDFQNIYNECSDNLKNRIICDFIAGMTDRYSVEFYGRLFSNNYYTIFKPF
jgi:dGTPase